MCLTTATAGHGGCIFLRALRGSLRGSLRDSLRGSLRSSLGGSLRGSLQAGLPAPVTLGRTGATATPSGWGLRRVHVPTSPPRMPCGRLSGESGGNAPPAALPTTASTSSVCAAQCGLPSHALSRVLVSARSATWRSGSSVETLSGPSGVALWPQRQSRKSVPSTRTATAQSSRRSRHGSAARHWGGPCEPQRPATHTHRAGCGNVNSRTHAAASWRPAPTQTRPSALASLRTLPGTRRPVSRTKGP